MKRSWYLILIPLLLSNPACKKPGKNKSFFNEIRIFPDGYSMADLYFQDKDTGYAASFVGTSTVQFATTFDGGNHWKVTPMEIEGAKVSKINNIFAINSSTIYATFAYGYPGIFGICVSHDLGLTWKSIGIEPTGINYHSVVFLDSNVGFVNRSSILIKTEDGGKTWKEVNRVTGLTGSGRTFFTSRMVGYIYGGATFDGQSSGLILKTEDEGETWKNLPFNGQNGEVTGLYFKSDHEGYAFTALQKAFKTTDGGATWTLLWDDLPGTSFSVAVADGYLYFGASGKIYRSNSDLSDYSLIYASPFGTAFLDYRAFGFSGGPLYFSSQYGLLKISLYQ